MSVTPPFEQDDVLEFTDDDEVGQHSRAEAWRILIVDDDEEVHNATTFALHDVELQHRPLQFLHAYSALEAKELLRREEDIAAILLDVVMESDHAGLGLVKVIREELHLKNLRIILRTGQPGYAPELEAIQQYDINDYKTKAELTRTRLVTTLTTAIRSYDQLHQLDSHRRGLTLIVGAAADLFARRGLEDFAEGVLLQIATLLGVRPEGLICAQEVADAQHKGKEEPMVVGAAGRYRPLINQPLVKIPDPGIVALVQACLQSRQSAFGEMATVLFFHTHTDRGIAVYVETPEPLSHLDLQLLEVFCVNISVGFDNVDLFSRLHSFAFFDQLTRLPNRTSLIQAIDERLAIGRKDWTLALIDIDHFSEINDALGHSNGDRLLQVIAKRLSHIMGKNTRLARVAADAYALFGPDNELEPKTILGEFDSPFGVNEHFLRVKATLGLAKLIDSEGDGLTALKDANIALNRAKQERRGGFVYYNSALLTATRERLRILHDLRGAIEAKGLKLYYQPQVALSDDRIVGVEALIRWQTSSGFVPPDQFIPIAEYSGLIIDLGEWVLRTACLQLANWLQAGMPPIRMAVNVSPVQFRNPGFVETVRRAIHEIGVPAELIELEITESVAMENIDSAIESLNRLKQIGVAIAIDDFGTGFSSLAYLQQLAVDRLKIDRSFIRDITAPGHQRASIAEMIIRLGANLGLTVIAEGVETDSQRDKLLALGCHEAQGYLYAQALPPDHLAGWVKSYSRPAESGAG